MLRPPLELSQKNYSHSMEGKEQTSYPSRNEDELGDQRTSTIGLMKPVIWQDDWIAPLHKAPAPYRAHPGLPPDFLRSSSRSLNACLSWSNSFFLASIFACFSLISPREFCCVIAF